jgi:hypothetical protein
MEKPSQQWRVEISALISIITAVGSWLPGANRNKNSNHKTLFFFFFLREDAREKKTLLLGSHFFFFFFFFFFLATFPDTRKTLSSDFPLTLTVRVHFIRFLSVAIGL